MGASWAQGGGKALTEHRTRGIVTGETGLAHSRAANCQSVNRQLGTWRARMEEASIEGFEGEGRMCIEAPLPSSKPHNGPKEGGQLTHCQ
jgi:hypothetical protein